MKVFISVDMEGLTTTTAWEECEKGHPSYARHAEQMTEEVLAAIRGAVKAGAKEIVVRDAHATGRNIDPTVLPENVSIIRGWTGSPYGMIEGIDSSFDAVLFIGYHSPAGKDGNPMSHTTATSHVYTKLNGKDLSEFMMYSFLAAKEGVPTVFLSGDKMLCEDMSTLHPKLVTQPVKEGKGGMTKNYSTKFTLRAIEENVEKALSQDLSDAIIELDDFFEAEVCFIDVRKAEKASHFPGVRKINGNTVKVKNKEYLELLRALYWIY